MPFDRGRENGPHRLVAVGLEEHFSRCAGAIDRRVAIGEEVAQPFVQGGVAVEELEHVFVDERLQRRHRRHQAGNAHRHRIGHLRRHLVARHRMIGRLKRDSEIGGREDRRKLAERLERNGNDPSVE